MKLNAVNETCSGCRACLLACALENFRQMNPSMAALSIHAEFPDPGRYRIALCDQCGLCAEACPEAAIHSDNGVYTVNAEECSGCMTCVEICPHEVMFAHRLLAAPIKCTLCGQCVEACPRGALVLED